MKKKIRAKSWSKQARIITDIFWYGFEDKEDGLINLHDCWRPKLIVRRAIKGYVRRLKRKGLR